MTVRTLCLSFFVVVVGIEQSVADFNSSIINVSEYSFPHDSQPSTDSKSRRDIGNSMYNQYADPDSWDIELENHLAEYMIKKDTPIMCTLIIKNVESIEGFNIDWYWPSGNIIDRTLIPETTISFPGRRMVKQTYILDRVPVGGIYKVKVSKNGKFKILAANVWVCSNSPSSGIRMESSFLALVVVWFTCRSVAFAPTA